MRDVKDDIVLAAAVGGRALYIVSGDDDLLVLGTYENIEILDVATFIKKMG